MQTLSLYLFSLANSLQEVLLALMVLVEEELEDELLLLLALFWVVLIR